MFKEIESACKDSERECVCVYAEIEIESVREIESACKGSGRECVCLEREGECTETERERERERERQRDGKCVQREGRSVF